MLRHHLQYQPEDSRRQSGGRRWSSRVREIVPRLCSTRGNAARGRSRQCQGMSTAFVLKFAAKFHKCYFRLSVVMWLRLSTYIFNSGGVFLYFLL